MKEQPEALRLAAALIERHGVESLEGDAAAELRRLAAVEAQRDALLEALKEITPSMPPVDAPCHYGIVPQEKCGHCGRIAKARAALAQQAEPYAAQSAYWAASDRMGIDPVTGNVSIGAQQAEPVTIERLRDALVASRIIPPAAVEDPDGYDDGVTLFRIEALHRRLT